MVQGRVGSRGVSKALFCGVAVASLILAACGSDDDSTTEGGTGVRPKWPALIDAEVLSMDDETGGRAVCPGRQHANPC